MLTEILLMVVKKYPNMINWKNLFFLVCFLLIPISFVDAVGYGLGSYGPGLYSATMPNNLTASPAAASYNTTKLVTLTANNSSIIRYSLSGIPASCSVDSLYSGSITISSSSTIYARACDNYGNSITASFSYIIDSNLPVISSLGSNNLSVISWVTDKLASSIVDYGLTTSYGFSTTETDTSPRVLNHSISLSNLKSCTTYHYRVRSKDNASNEAISSDNIFTTTGCTASSSISDIKTSQVDKNTGGSLMLKDSNSYGLSLTIPANFATSSANFQAHKLNKETVLNTISTPSGVTAAGNYVYELKALANISDTISVFNNPLTISITYNSSEISGLNESSLKIYRWDNGTWTKLSNCSVNTNTKTVTCETNHFSTFVLFGEQGNNNNNNSSNSMPASWSLPPVAPVGGFKINTKGLINNKNINLLFTVGTDVSKMAISNYSDFRNASLENYSLSKNWDICSGLSNCSYGEHMVYVKFYTKYGVSSDAIAVKVNYQPVTVINNTTSKPVVISKKNNFQKDLKLGLINNDVKLLQQFLNSNGYLIAKSGIGSKGKETNYFGPATKAALIKFQKANKINPASGLFGPLTRKVVNSK